MPPGKGFLLLAIAVGAAGVAIGGITILHMADRLQP